MHDAGCRRKRLATGAVATVESCSCGRFHLHMGGLTLQFERDAFACLVHTLGSAVHASEAEQQRAADDLKLLLGQLD